MHWKTFAAAAAITVAFMGAAQASEISRVSDEWAKDWSAGDLGAIMKLYAPKPVFLPTSGDRWEGDVTIRENFAKGIAQFKADLRMKSSVSEGEGQFAYDSGAYEETVIPKAGGKGMSVKGNYLFVFQRAHDGAWKILEQTFTQHDPAKL